MKKTNYVSTSLGAYLNENRSITLTRKYGKTPSKVVGSRAPLRNKVLAFIAENKRVSQKSLKKFIRNINEGKSTVSAINMWISRNKSYFITESKTGGTYYKLSPLGKKLARLTPLSESKNQKMTTDKEKQARVKRIIEGIKAKRNFALNEEEDLVDEEVEEEVEEGLTDNNTAAKNDTGSISSVNEDDESDDDVDDTDVDELPDMVDDDEDGDELTDDDSGEDEELDEEPADGERVEITEFIITVDDVDSAIEELGELGVAAAEVADEMELDSDGLDADLDGEESDDLGDFDLDMGGEIGGDEEPLEDETEDEIEEGAYSAGGSYDTNDGSGKHNLFEDGEELEESDDACECSNNEQPELNEDDIDIEFGDDEGDEGDELSDEGDELSDDDLDSPEGDDLEDVGGEKQIKVDASNWEALKGWLETKDVDIADLFGGDIEVEGGEEGSEDDIDFDSLEELPEEGGDGSEEGDDFIEASKDGDDDESDDDLDF